MPNESDYHGLAALILIRYNPAHELNRRLGHPRRYPALTIMTWKLSKSVSAVVERAVSEAIKRNHDYISTEHIFLALLNTKNSIAECLLNHFSITCQLVVAHIDQIAQRGDLAVSGACGFPLTPRAKAALDAAESESVENGSEEIDEPHLMIGLLLEPRELISLTNHPDRMCDTPTVVTQAFKNAGLDLHRARDYIRKREYAQDNRG